MNATLQESTQMITELAQDEPDDERSNEISNRTAAARKKRDELRNRRADKEPSDRAHWPKFLRDADIWNEGTWH